MAKNGGLNCASGRLREQRRNLPGLGESMGFKLGENKHTIGADIEDAATTSDQFDLCVF